MKSLGVSLAEDEEGRGAAELRVGDARYLLDREQVDYLIHTRTRSKTARQLKPSLVCPIQERLRSPDRSRRTRTDRPRKWLARKPLDVPGFAP